jgi:plastocyanin
MKKILTTIIILGLFIALPVFAHSDEDSHGEGVVVEISDKSFSPSVTTITKGTKVIFENVGTKNPWPASNIHPTHRGYPGSDIELCDTEKEETLFDACRGLEEGETYEFTFENSGDWRYHDHNDPRLKGRIIVVESNNNVDDSNTESSLIKKIWRSIRNFFKNTFSTNSDRAMNALTGAFKEEIEEFDKNYDKSISSDSQDIFSDKQALFSYVKKYGPGEATRQLHHLEYDEGFGFCHNTAHDAGRFGYALNGGEAFQKCSAECHSGCYHGATEAYFRDRGLDNLIDDLSLLCDESLNSFFSHQCVHGIGHGLMAWTDYDIHEALLSCDSLPQGQDSCYSGVFMENVVGGLAGEEGHFTEYLSDDPHMPCNVVDDKYVNGCYFYQTSRMVQLFGSDFSKVAKACSEIDSRYQNSCFSSMGRDAGGSNIHNNDGAIAGCNHAPEGLARSLCLSGAVQNTFWVSDGQDEAMAFCRLVDDVKDKNVCYNTIFSRATQLMDDQEFEDFCQKAEEDFVEQCLRY